MRTARPAALALVLALLGCVAPTSVPELTGSSSPFTDPFGGFSDPLVTGHDHADVAAHELASPTMRELAHLAFDAPFPTVAVGETDLLGADHLLVAALLQGFYVVDVKDRAKPSAVSFTPDPGYVADIKASPSGNFAFLGIQLAGFTGIHAWNLAVKERPVFAGAFPMAGGCHMLDVHRSFLYCAPNDATVRIFEIVETPAAVALVPVGAYSPKGAPPPAIIAGQDAGDEFTHDMTVQDDPLTGEPVMFVSFWDHGVRVVDVADPAKPVELGGWTGEGADETYGGALHTSMAALVGGKRVVVTVPEYAPVPSVTMLDATDYANMRPLAVWAPKTDFGEDAPSTFSTHNFQLAGERMYLAMYHGGVWVLDLADRLAPLGYILTAAEGTSAVPFFGGTAGSVWDVVLRDGHVYATDIGNGLHVVALDGDVGNAALTSWA